ncbi:ABC transporter substrate-binding protein [Brevibacterium sp. RIT 803]|uniref:ABC transporter substrate-binding protein n=1 Tax=Brevibacterium sp. RIT 803 TaxID=2810210 RepID=UPI0019507EC9|nr:ABC transporter substrate-binding protein [Brevibacterium sp. RIT 803]MBM6589630.1 ABC transporter substrate-binding protein [Brevibacterium sp. RIT 803]
MPTISSHSLASEQPASPLRSAAALSRPRGQVLLSLLAAGSLLLAGCSGNAQAEADAGAKPQSGGTLKIAYDVDPTCLDGQQQGTNVTLNVTRQITDSLTDQDPETQEIKPWLAESWDVSANAKTFTFQLRDGVTFQDGTDFTSASVKENFEAIQDLGAKASLGQTYLDGLKSITTPDESTVTFEFDKSNAQFLQATSTMSLGFYSSDTLAKSAEERCTGDIVGTGPFTLDSFVHNKAIKLSRFDDYNWPSSIAKHEGPAHLDGIEFSIVPEASVRNGSLLSGQVDVDFSVQSQDEKTLEAQGLGIVSRPNPGVVYNLVPKLTGAIAADKSVRRALVKGIDREQLKSVISEHQAPATSVLAKSTPEYEDVSDLLAYDPEGAKKLLDDAGWKPGENGIREKDGKPLSVTLTYWQDASFLELVQQQLREIGFDLKLEKKSTAEVTALQAEGKEELTFGNLTRADGDVLRNYFGASEQNGNARKPGELDKILARTTSTLDEDERTADFTEAVKVLIDEGYSIPIVELSGVIGTGKDVHDFNYEASSRFQLYDAWLDGEAR